MAGRSWSRDSGALEHTVALDNTAIMSPKKYLTHPPSSTVVFSSEEQKQSVLQWLAEAGPVRVEHLDTVWRHGWVLCGVLDAALPGACAGHPPTRLSLKHAQAIADHYLGVEPVSLFSFFMDTSTQWSKLNR